MTEEQLKAKKIFAGEKKASMKRRDDNHDYTERRMYMITLEVEGRHPVFGHLVGDPFAERGSPAEARIELSALGRAVEREWLGISRYFPQIEVKAVQMMPDHMHGILFVREPLPVHLGQVISGFKAGCRKAQRALAAAEPQPTGEGAAAYGEGAAAYGEGAAAYGEGAAAYGEGAASYGEGAAAYGEGAASYGEGAAAYKEGGNRGEGAEGFFFSAGKGFAFTRAPSSFSAFPSALC